MRRAAASLAFLVAVAAAPAFGFQRETTDDPPCQEKAGTNCGHHGAELRWHGIPVLYSVNSALSGVSPSAVEQAIQAAFATWQSASGDAIRFQFAGQTTSGTNGMDDENVVLWTPLSSSADTFAQSILTYDSHSGALFDVDIQFNSKFAWAVLPTGENKPGDSRVDIQAVGTHEAGHLLGLAHENRFGPEIVMYFSDTSGNTTHRSLTSDDRTGVQSIYGGSSSDGGGGGGGGGGCALARGGGRGDVASVLFLLAAFALGRRRRRTAR